MSCARDSHLTACALHDLARMCLDFREAPTRLRSRSDPVEGVNNAPVIIHGPLAGWRRCVSHPRHPWLHAMQAPVECPGFLVRSLRLMCLGHDAATSRLLTMCEWQRQE